MLRLNEFIAQYNGRKVGYPNDQTYPGQCVSLVKWWNQNLGYPVRYGNGKDWINNAGSDYLRYDYKPGELPIEGDIISWAAAKPADPTYGHVAIVIKADANGFQSFDQGWGKDICQVVYHNYQSVQGWIRPKNYTIGGDIDMVDDKDKPKGSVFKYTDSPDVYYKVPGPEAFGKYFGDFSQVVDIGPDPVPTLVAQRDSLQVDVNNLTEENKKLAEELAAKPPLPTIPDPTQPTEPTKPPTDSQGTPKAPKQEAFKLLLRLALFFSTSGVLAWLIQVVSGLPAGPTTVALGGFLTWLDKYLHENPNIKSSGIVGF